MIRRGVRRGETPRALAISAALLLSAGCSQDANETYQGYVEGEFVYLSSSQAGLLERLSVVRGQQVAADAALFRLESIEEQAAQRQAQHLLDASEAQLRDLQSGKRPPEVAVTLDQLKQAEAQSANSMEKRQRDEAQFLATTISREQLEATQAQAEIDAAHVAELRSQVEVAKLPGREQQLRAQSQQVEAARAALAAADWRLAQKTVAAPGAGQVIDTLYRVGEWVAAGSPVVELLPPQNIKARFFVPEPDLGRITLGQKVRLRCDGCAEAVDASVTFISPQSEYTPPVIFSNETRAKLVFMIEAHPTPADAPKLHPGQPLIVSLK